MEASLVRRSFPLVCLFSLGVFFFGWFFGLRKSNKGITNVSMHSAANSEIVLIYARSSEVEGYNAVLMTFY